MSLVYDTFETLRQQNAVLRETVALNTGIQLAAWYNKHDTITVKSNHHTLSLYVADGYESYQKTPGGWKNGGGPDRFCLMPEESESTWDIRDDLSFVHLYCTDEHLRDVGEKIWDKRPLSLTLEEKNLRQRSENHRPLSPVFARLRLAAKRQSAHPEHRVDLIADAFGPALFQRTVEAAGSDRRVITVCTAQRAGLYRGKPCTTLNPGGTGGPGRTQ